MRRALFPSGVLQTRIGPEEFMSREKNTRAVEQLCGKREVGAEEGGRQAAMLTLLGQGLSTVSNRQTMWPEAVKVCEFVMG